MTNRNPLEEKELRVVNGGVGEQINVIHKGDYFISIDESIYIIARVGNENETTLIPLDFDMYSYSDDFYLGKWNGMPSEMSSYFTKVSNKCNPDYVPHA